MAAGNDVVAHLCTDASEIVIICNTSYLPEGEYYQFVSADLMHENGQRENTFPLCILDSKIKENHHVFDRNQKWILFLCTRGLSSTCAVCLK